MTQAPTDKCHAYDYTALWGLPKAATAKSIMISICDILPIEYFKWSLRLSKIRLLRYFVSTKAPDMIEDKHIVPVVHDKYKGRLPGQFVR